MIDTAQIFETFVGLHTASTEVYNPTPANIRRWLWHINQATTQQREAADWKKWERVLPEKGFEELIHKRRVNSWADFPERTKGVYLHLAGFFPGSPVYACGSRVRGDYVEEFDPPRVHKWREMAGKTAKPRSDFDLWAPLSAIQIGELPAYADRLKHGVAETEKIFIPMESWDFSKLPASEHERVVSLVNAGGWRELVEIHDRYKLSPYTYCCDISGLKNWYFWAIKTGVINGSKGTDTGI